MKPLMTIALLAAALPAAAENWVRYAQVDDASRYYDKERVLLMSGTAFIWDLHDLRAETAGNDGKPHRSVTYATEVNCRKELMLCSVISRWPVAWVRARWWPNSRS